VKELTDRGTTHPVACGAVVDTLCLLNGAPDETPFPLNATVCGLPGALSVIVRAADRAPAAVGLKVTLIVQVAPAATDVPQVLTAVKSVLLAPAITLADKLRTADPLLVILTACAALAVFKA
jgi:hypothetical protein